MPCTATGFGRPAAVTLPHCRPLSCQKPRSTGASRRIATRRAPKERDLSDEIVTTFSSAAALAGATARLDALGLAYAVHEPPSGTRRVAVPALVVDRDLPREIARRGGVELACAGWIDRRPVPAADRVPGPDGDAPVYDPDIFGDAAVMVLASCTTDVERIRVIAHISGDLSEVFPYLNAEMNGARFNPKGPTLTYMQDYRLVTIYARRVAIAKADDLDDAWRILEEVRRRANEVWDRRGRIAPSWQVRERPTLIDLLKALPRTNCRACGQATCTAFATRLLGGEATAADCLPVEAGEYAHLRDALADLCAGIELVDRSG